MSHVERKWLPLGLTSMILINANEQNNEIATDRTKEIYLQSSTIQYCWVSEIAWNKKRKVQTMPKMPIPFWT